MATVPRLPPQLPPLSQQPSLVLYSNSSVHRRREDGGAVHPPRHGSGSPSPPPPLPEPFEEKVAVAGASFLEFAPFEKIASASFLELAAPGSDTSSKGSSRQRSRSRSRSRVPIPILPSASSSEPIIISPPNKAHSRNASNGTPPMPPPTPPLPSASGKVYGLPPRPSRADRDRDTKRPLPKVPKPTPPQLTVPDLASAPKRSKLPPRKSSLSNDSASLSSPPTPFTPQSAPPMRTPSKRRNADASSSPVPVSAPAEKTKERELIEERLRQKRNERAKYIALRRDQPFVMDLLTENHDGESESESSSNHLPERQPSPVPGSTTLPPTIPAIVRPDVVNGRRGADLRTPSPPPFAYSTVSRTRNDEVAMALRPSVSSAATDRAASPQRQVNGTGYTRKWVLEKNGKRLTQDTFVAAEQLRKLR